MGGNEACAGKWRDIAVSGIMDLGGDWAVNAGDGRGPRRGRLTVLKDGLSRLEQSTILGLSNMAVHLPYLGFRAEFGMRLVKGQEAKFNLTCAGTDTSTRLDFFGAHRPGAVRLSVDDNPWSDAREFDLSGIDFTRGCAVGIGFSGGVLDLKISARGRTWKKRYLTQKTFSGVFGFGTYRGRAVFDGIRVQVRDGDFSPLCALKTVYVGCAGEADAGEISAAVGGLRALDCGSGAVPALRAVPVVFSGLGPADGGVAGMSLADVCVFVPGGEGLCPGMAVAAGAALRSGRRCCVVCSGRTAARDAARLSGWGFEAVVRDAGQTAAQAVCGLLEREI